MQHARFWIVCSMGALLIISCALLISVKLKSTGVENIKNLLPADVDMRLDNLILSKSGTDGRSMVINADSAHYYKTQDRFALKTVNAKILTPDDGSYYIIVADDAVYEQSAQLIHLTGQVRINDYEGAVLYCPSLIFDFAKNELKCESDFCLDNPGYSLEGSSFIFNDKEKQFDAKGRVNFILH